MKLRAFAPFWQKILHEPGVSEFKDQTLLKRNYSKQNYDMTVRIRNIFILIFINLLPVTSSLHSQVVVERSKDKVVISGKPYYIHIVKKGETAYSISKAYYITVDDLVRENPAASNGLREGQSLRLPLVDSPPQKQKPVTQQQQQQRDETKYIYHRLVSGDTVFSLARRFGVSEQEILDSNPGVEINKLAIGTEIAIPKREFTTTSQKIEITEKEFINHRVEKGESLSSIADKYGITVREIRKENRGVIFPRVDDYIKIPVSKIVEPLAEQELIADTSAIELKPVQPLYKKPMGFTRVENLGGKINVALLLPLYLRENAIRTEIDSSQKVRGKPVYKIIKRKEDWIYPKSLPFLELYQGMLIAADTLRSLGLNIDISVFDIRSDSIELTRIINAGKLSDMDIIVGPVYSHNLSIVARYAGPRNIPVISPVPLRSNTILNNNPLVFMTNPSLEVAQEVISSKVRENASANFVFIHTDSIGFDPGVASFKNMLLRELSSVIPNEEIRFKELLFYSRSMLSNDSINRLEHTLSDKSENVVLIASEDPPVLSETIMDLHTLSKKYKIKLLGYPAMRDLKNLEPKYYFDLGIELYSPYWIDYRKTDIKKFLASFSNKFLSEPPEESFAWQGYDIAYYFLSGIALHGESFLATPEMHNPDLLETEFYFIRTCENCGFENHKLFHIRYTNDMEVKLIEDSILY